MLATRRKAQVWRAKADLPVRRGPSTSEPVIETIAAGAYFPTIQEQAELRSGAWVTIGPWRTVVLSDDRTGYVHRDGMDPVAEGAAAFDRLNRGTLYEIDTAAVPPWPIPTSSGISETEAAKLAANAAKAAAADVKKAANSDVDAAAAKYGA